MTHGPNKQSSLLPQTESLIGSLSSSNATERVYLMMISFLKGITYLFNVSAILGKYRLFPRLAALLLLMAFFLPATLQACQIADFCMMEMNSHDMSSHQMSDRPHEYCESSAEESGNSAHSHSDCEDGSVCDCYVDQFPSSEEILVPVSSVAIIFQENRLSHTLLSSDEPIRRDQRARIGQYNPPLYLHYDTLLS